MSKEVKLVPFFPDGEKFNTKSLEGAPRSWGVNYLQAPFIWPRWRGSNWVWFPVDTEGGTTHPDVAPYTLHGACRRFTSEATDGLGHHGLHVGHTILQVAPGASLVFLKGLRDDGGGSATAIATAIRYAADVVLPEEHQGKRRGVNLSLGADIELPAIREAIRYAHSRGVVVVCAAGNDGRDVDYPGAWPEVIAVGAVDQNGLPAAFSSPGEMVDVAAPGVAITAAWEDGYRTLNGTSMATPHVAGALALIGEARPDLNTPELMQVFLKEHASDIHEPGKDGKTGYGVPFVTKYPLDEVGPIPEPPRPEEPAPAWPWWAWVLIGVGAVGALIGLVLSLT